MSIPDMSLPDCFAMRSPSPTPEELEDRKLFLRLVKGMDLPKYRVLNHDYHWMIRNAGFRNSNHPNFQELIAFLKRKILENR